HEAMALLICAAVAPELSVAQMVVRFGMPPWTPGFVLRQSIARDAATIPVHGGPLPPPPPAACTSTVTRDHAFQVVHESVADGAPAQWAPWAYCRFCVVNQSVLEVHPDGGSK